MKLWSQLQVQQLQASVVDITGIKKTCPSPHTWSNITTMSSSDSPPSFQVPLDTSAGSLPTAGFGCESPVGMSSVSPPQLTQLSAASAVASTPSSPQMVQRGSSGRLVGGKVGRKGRRGGGRLRDGEKGEGDRERERRERGMGLNYR